MDLVYLLFLFLHHHWTKIRSLSGTKKMALFRQSIRSLGFSIKRHFKTNTHSDFLTGLRRIIWSKSVWAFERGSAGNYVCTSIKVKTGSVIKVFSIHLESFWGTPCLSACCYLIEVVCMIGAVAGCYSLHTYREGNYWTFFTCCEVQSNTKMLCR